MLKVIAVIIATIIAVRWLRDLKKAIDASRNRDDSK